jgi:carbon monoxide dehydrogenase subunit G
LTVNPVAAPDFSVSASPSSRTIAQGGTATYTVTVQSFNGFNSTVSLTALNLPGNQVLPGTGFSPQTLTPPSNSSTSATFSFVSNTSTPTGTFTITVQGQGGGLTRSTTVSLTVTPPPDFTVSASPSSNTITQGGTATYNITVQSFNGFSSAVSLTALNLPGNQVLPGTGFSPQTVTPPANGSTTSTFSFVSNTSTPTGTFTITVQGQGGGLTRTTAVSLTVNPAAPPDFSVSASPSSRTIAQGGTATYIVTVQSANGFNSAVSLTALNLPGNQVLPGTGFSPQTITPPANGSTTSTFSFVSNTSTPTGNFTITVQGQGGGLTRSTTVSLTVTPPPDFTVSALPSSNTITQGGTASYTITVQSLNGFNSGVSLTALNLPGNQVLPGTDVYYYDPGAKWWTNAKYHSLVDRQSSGCAGLQCERRTKLTYD